MTDHRHRTYVAAICAIVMALLGAVLLGTLIHSMESQPEQKMIQVPVETPTPEADI